MKFCQLIKHNIKAFFLEKLYTQFFEEKYISCYIILFGQILLSSCQAMIYILKLTWSF